MCVVGGGGVGVVVVGGGVVVHVVDAVASVFQGLGCCWSGFRVLGLGSRL